jgi:hypothetical protein
MQRANGRVFPSRLRCSGPVHADAGGKGIDVVDLVSREPNLGCACVLVDSGRGGADSPSAERLDLLAWWATTVDLSHLAGI